MLSITYSTRITVSNETNNQYYETQWIAKKWQSENGKKTRKNRNESEWSGRYVNIRTSEQLESLNLLSVSNFNDILNTGILIFRHPLCTSFHNDLALIKKINSEKRFAFISSRHLHLLCFCGLFLLQHFLVFHCARGASFDCNTSLSSNTFSLVSFWSWKWHRHRITFALCKWMSKIRNLQADKMYWWWCQSAVNEIDRNRKCLRSIQQFWISKCFYFRCSLFFFLFSHFALCVDRHTIALCVDATQAHI